MPLIFSNTVEARCENGDFCCSSTAEEGGVRSWEEAEREGIWTVGDFDSGDCGEVDASVVVCSEGILEVEIGSVE